MSLDHALFRVSEISGYRPLWSAPFCAGLRHTLLGGCGWTGTPACFPLFLCLPLLCNDLRHDLHQLPPPLPFPPDLTAPDAAAPGKLLVLLRCHPVKGDQVFRCSVFVHFSLVQPRFARGSVPERAALHLCWYSLTAFLAVSRASGHIAAFSKYRIDR